MANGLLDFLQTPAGQGLLAATFGGLAGARRGEPINSLGRAGLAGLSGYAGAQNRQMIQENAGINRELRDLQIQQMRAAQEREAMRGKVLPTLFQTPTSEPQISINSMGLPQVDRAAMQTGPAAFNTQEALKYFSPQEVKAMQEVASAGQPQEYTLTPGSARFRGDKQIAAVPKESAQPSSFQEFILAQQNPAFAAYQQGLKRAGASNIDVKVDAKTGESVASQIGPMAKDLRIQTQGAVKMFDAADRIEKALESNAVMSGPLANQRMTVKQFVTTFAGGDDTSVRNTRQVIKSLAQMAVEARKQLQGQGQVTESEAAAVAKADAGNIEDLTTGELADLVTLTKRASYFQASAYQDMMNTMGAQESTKGMVPFYRVQGVDRLLSQNPQLPQIGTNKSPAQIGPFADPSKEQRYQQWLQERMRSQGR